MILLRFSEEFRHVPAWESAATETATGRRDDRLDFANKTVV